MSLGEVQRFYQKIRHDSDFFQLFTKTLQAVPDKYRDQIIDNFAKEQGFDFSIEEFKNFTGAFENSDLKNNSPEAKLSVNKLERVFYLAIRCQSKNPGDLPGIRTKETCRTRRNCFNSCLISDCYLFVFALHLKL